MEANKTSKLRVFIDADVLIAGSASPNEHSASLILLRMAEITLVEAIASRQVLTEVERNLRVKLPGALPAFSLLVSRCLKIVPDPGLEDIRSAQGAADPKDLPILVAAKSAGCTFLTTYNLRHFRPGLPEVTVLNPGDLVLRVRYLLANLSTNTILRKP
jgi:predicted nucleic acid-binding protein